MKVQCIYAQFFMSLALQYLKKVLFATLFKLAPFFPSKGTVT